MPKTATSPMITLLAHADALVWADLFTITLLDGTVLRYTNAQVPVRYSGHVWSSGTPLVERDTIQWQTGLVVDEMVLTITALPTDMVGSLPILQAIHAGALDGAAVQLDRLYSTTFGDWSYGSVPLFYGNVSDITNLTRLAARLTVKSRLEKLNINMPRNYYQPGCGWTLFDDGCALVKSAFGVAGVVAAGSISSLAFTTNLTAADAYYDLGTLTFTSGALVGESASVRHYLNSTGLITLYRRLPSVPVVGAAFLAYPGCDKRLTTCDVKFSNTANFRGFPSIPPAEQAI